MFDRIKRNLKSKESFLLMLMAHGFYDSMSDEEYLRLKYRLIMGKELSLTNPQSFNEKIQWLKLYNRRPEYTTMVDKYAVKEYVARIIGEEYIIPTIGVWDNPNDIDFSVLPSRFVLKCNHNSGLGMFICQDKEGIDEKRIRHDLKKGLKEDFYLRGREWPYKHVKRRIIAEQFLEDEDSPFLKDYKFFCFNGKVEFLYISEGWDNHETARISYVTLDWKQAEFYRDDYKPFDSLPAKPYNYEKMIQLAEKLSKGIPFVRVDFYEVNRRVLFGELTFFTGSGFTKFVPEEWDLKLGSLISLPEKSVLN